MAEDSDAERTEDASPRRLEEARNKGNVARSRELVTFAVLMSGLTSLVFMSDQFFGHMAKITRASLTFDRSMLRDPRQMLELLQNFGLDTLLAFMPFLMTVTLAAFLSPMLLSGWLFTTDPLIPNFGKLNPVAGISRMFSVNALTEMVKTIIKTSLIGGIAFYIIWSERGEFIGLSAESLESSFGHTAHLVAHTMQLVVGSLIILVVIDVPYQLWHYHHSLRMSKEELRQESKESEGDPQLKGRIRAMQREAARRRMMQEVPKADVIVTNPTHYAVALSYQSSSMTAPKVVAKGAHLIAERIIELGKENSVAILRTPPFARALYFNAEIGQEIPAKLYTAAAEVLAYVYQLKSFQSEGGIAPEAPSELPVPADMDPENKAGGTKLEGGL